jgi:hypothetical protein
VDATVEAEPIKDKETIMAVARTDFCKKTMPRYFKFMEKPKTKTGYVDIFKNSAFMNARAKILHAKHGFWRCGLYYCAASSVIPYNAGVQSNVSASAIPYPGADAKLAIEAFTETCGNLALSKTRHPLARPPIFPQCGFQPLLRASFNLVLQAFSQCFRLSASASGFQPVLASACRHSLS